MTLDENMLRQQAKQIRTIFKWCCDGAVQTNAQHSVSFLFFFLSFFFLWSPTDWTLGCFSGTVLLTYFLERVQCSQRRINKRLSWCRRQERTAHFYAISVRWKCEPASFTAMEEKEASLSSKRTSLLKNCRHFARNHSFIFIFRSEMRKAVCAEWKSRVRCEYLRDEKKTLLLLRTDVKCEVDYWLMIPRCGFDINPLNSEPSIQTRCWIKIKIDGDI